MSRSNVTFRPEDAGTLVDVLKQRAARQPDRTAYIFLSDKGRREERLTYAELDREARKTAAFLLGLGAPGDRVVLLYPPGLEYIVSFMGCLYAGMIAVPLYPPRRNQKIFRVEEIFKNARPVAAVTCASLYETVSGFMRSEPGYEAVSVYSTTGLPGQREADLPAMRAHDLAFLQYTSGSTGAPKGVMVGHGNLMANGRAIRDCFRNSEEDVFVSWVPLFHDMGLILNVLQPLYVGCLSVLMSPLDFVQNPMRWLEAMAKYGGTVGGGPNFAFDLCVEKISPEKVATLDLRSWRLAYNGAEPIRAETLERFTRKFASVGFRHQAFHCCFGMAEATLMVTGGDPSALPVVSAFDKAALAARSATPTERGASAAVLVGCGKVPEDHRVCIVDPGERRALPDGEVGEIWIAGPSVAGGYWDRPDLSRETFEATTESGEGPFLRTGDLGFFRGGELYVAGRMKDTIILRGRNLYPQDIEAVVSTSHPALKPYCAAAFGVEVDGEERVVVVQEVARGSKSTAWSEVFPVIHQAVAESHDLSLHAVVLIPTGSLPLTSSGKVQRHAARARFLEGSLDVVARSGALGAERREESAGPPPEVGPARHDVDHLQEVVLRLVAAALKVSPGDLDVSRPLAQYGLSSKAAIALTGDLEGELKIPVSPTLVYDHPTIAQLALALASRGAPAPARTTEGAPVRLEGRQEAVAIIGIGCRFPGASGPEAFWELLQQGGDAIRELPPERRALLGLRDDGEPLWGGYLDGIERFDPEHFGISPREADVIDPQQRLVLEVAHEALHFAGVAPSRLAGSLTGVFMGVSTHDYERLAAGSSANAFSAAGSASSVVANRLSYTLDLRGPSVVVDTACSSSLVAVHYACRSLESGECDVAIAGGVNVLLDPGVTRAMTDGHFMAPDGRCKTFDASADGYVRSEGCGVVVLKRLRDALRDGDPVLAVIRGSALHQDGRSNGLHAPNGPAQEAVLRAALDRAGVAPAQIQYVEAHGTGTALGDPIEFGAIRNVLSRDRGPEARCGVGSVKTNLGHMEAAAGIGGLLKVVHALRHRELPGNLFLRQLNPHISLDGGFYIPSRSVPWETGGEPRLAGVSSFGFGGTIAHVVLEQAPAEAVPREADLPDARRVPRRPVHLLRLSARSDAALRELAERCKDHLASHPEVDVADFCHTLAVGRDAHELRLAVSARDAGELCRHLEGYLGGAVTPAVTVGRARRRPRVAFLFSGQGAQYSGMARALYETQPSVRDTIDRCDALVREHLGCSLLSILYPDGEPDGRIHQAQFAQVTLFSLQVALAELLMSWGIVPDAVMGHSLGEFAAACAAGVFDLEDGLRLVFERGRLLQSVSTGGGMVTVYASEAEVEQYLKSTPAVVVAAVNSPQNTLVSGPVEALERLMARLDADGIRNRRANVTLAGHSAMVEPILDDFEKIAAAAHHRAPRLLFGSTVTGRMLDEAPSARYWRAQLRQKVRFLEGLTSLRAAGCEVFVEIGPRQVLTGLADEVLGSGVSCFPTLKADVPEWETLTEMLAGLHISGVQVDLERVGRSEGLRRIPGLPSPGLERRRCWFDEAAPRAAGDVLAARANTMSPGASVASSVALLPPAPAARTAPHESAPPAATPAAPVDRASEILEQLRTVVARLLKTSPDRLDPDRPLLEIGADSLMLMDAIRAIRDHFSVEITVRQVFRELPTLAAIASYVDARMPPPAPAAPAAPPPSNGAGALTAPSALVQPPGEGTAAAVSRMMDQHTQVITMALQLLGAPRSAAPVQTAAPQAPAPPGARAAASPAVSRSPAPSLAPPAAGAPNAEARPEKDQKRSYTAFGPYNPASATAHTRLGEGDKQERHLRALAARYTEKTSKSKALTQQYRAVLADNRASAGFRFSTKEMVYPIAAERLEGPYVWDLDGNRYVDMAMGFGVSLLGHNPPLVSQAITRQLQSGGIELGPRSRYAGEVAALVCELTGVDRAAFCTSGTEAVMTALRLARTATGRTKIAMFGVSYHGHFDTVLARPSGRPGEPSLPMAPGVPDELVKDTIVLEYGDFSELERLRSIGGEIAAVLVEPVQSRRPGLQPGRFLRELRAVTRELGIVLIFDEMVTGFRVHPGGAQAYFDVRADLVTYGKVLGGGLPIGCVAGKAEFMDAIDGGYWSYGDGSYPGAETTFLAGTYQMHSLSMVSARAVLTHLKEQGPALQERLGARTAAFAERVREVFRETGAPIGLSSFSSYFRFQFEGNLDLFFYHLIDKGVFVWEGRTCFLSTAHADEDIDHIVSAVEETVRALQKDGFLPPPPRPGGPGSRTVSGSNGASAPREQGVAAGAPALDPSRAQAARETLPLSEAQKQLWFLAKLNPGALAAYVETTALEMHGPIDMGGLRRAVALLAERHDALRIHIAEDGSHQVVSPRAEVALDVVSCAAASEAEAEAKAARWLADASRVHLELHRGPLVRFTLLSLSDHRHELVIDGHHIVTDGLSLAVMLEDLAELYNALCEGRAPALAPAPPYGAFASHEQAYLASARAGIDESFWRTRFQGGIEPTELPTSRPRPGVFTFDGARHEIALDPETWRRLKEAGRQQGCTPFMLLLAGYLLLIARLAGREDIVVGFPVAGRSFEGGERFVGYCTHLAPFRARVLGDARFEELLAAVQRDMLDVYEHQEFPFAHLIRKLDHRVALDRGAAVSLAFNLNRVDTAVPFWRMRTAAVSTPIHHAKFDLLLDVLETGDTARLQFDYATSLFDEETIARFARAYVRLLTAGAERPARRLRELPLLSEDELRGLVEGFNQSERPYPQDRCLHELFEAQVARTPGRTALVFEGERLTYGELNTRANQLAHHLRRHGVGPDTVVAVVAERSLELVVALYGVLKAGGAYLPIDPTYPSERIRVVLEDAASPVVLTQEKWSSGLPETPARVVRLDADWAAIERERGDDPRPVGGPEHLAYVIYTSGSTGRPKGVENSHRGIVNRLLWMLEDSGLGEQDAVLQKTPYTFDVSVWELFAPLLCGARLVVAAPEGHRDPAYLADVIEAEAISTVHFVPSMLQAFLESVDGRQCRSLRRVICSGEALSRELQERFFGKLGEGEGAPELQNLYGPTEAAVDVTSWRCRRGDSHGSVPIGKPVANTRIYLLDGQLQPVPVGVPGELFIGGVQVARGYLKRPALTAERFIPDPFSRTPGARLYRTGDLARFLPDGTILFLGRIDHQVKLRGFRIELGEIEAALLASAQVREAAVLLREDRAGDPRLVAYVVPRSEPDVDVEALRRALELALPSYMVPSAFVALESLPLTTSGKLDRKALPAPELEPAARGEHVAPSGETEIKLAEIWQEVLGLSRAGSADEFFASGGHSLLATQLVSRVRSVFGVDLPLRAVFEAPVLAQLAARIERARAGRDGLDGAPTIPLVPRGDAPPPMSFAQERLWFLQQLDPGSTAYNMAAAVRLSGALDQGALHGCLREVVRRHDALRATFATDAEGGGVQRIAPAVALSLPLFDLSAMPEAEREGALARVAREEAERPFDLAEGPLVRSALVRLGATEHVWLLGMHHIVSDDWSIGVFVREVSALYAAYVAGQPSPLPPLPIQYADYARWQRQGLAGEALERELAYWTRQLAGIPSAMELPADRPRPAAQSFRGGEVAVVLPAELAQALRALSLRENATLFMTLLAAFQALLGRYSRQSDVVVGSPVANRTRAEVEGLIGFFVNTLALRADLSADPPFVELLRQVRDTALDAYAHQALPFERIVDALGVPRDLSRTPVFQVMFTLQNAPVHEMRLAGLSLREEEISTRTAKFDLDLTLREVDGALVGTLEYSADLFDAATVERMAGHLRALLEGVVAAPGTRLSGLPLLTAAERRQIVVERNRTARDFTAVRPEWRPEARFTELFEAQVERTPGAVAVECDGERWTYAELDERARRIARALRERGVGRDDVVGLLLDRGVELVAAILGVFKAGGAYMPLDADWPDQRLATALARSRARALVCAASSQGRAGALNAAPALCIAELLASSPAPRGSSPAEGSADDLAYVLFTSGSTGTPKGVMVTHAGMLNQQFAKVVELGLGAGDTMAQIARQTFDISVWQLLNLLLVGGRVLILKDEQAWAPGPLLTALSAQRATIFETVPSHLRLLLDELEARPEAYDLSALRWLMPTGEALLPELCERWFRAFPRVPMVNAYGPTECSDDTSLHKLYRAPSRAWKYVPIHGCVANLSNYVLDERLEPVPDGVAGELCIGGVGVGRGYIADPGRTAQAFVPDPFAGTPGARMYRTGDLVRFLPDGSIEFLGRIDHQVKIRGFRIEIGEIEAALSLHPGVRECVVVMREDGEDDRRLVAYVVPAAHAESGALARHLQERLPAYMVPSAFVLLDAFPLLSNGKIDRRALPAPAGGALDTAEHVPACTPTEAVLADIWRDLLRVDPVGRFANFFTLGGHSLLATRLVSRVREAFGVELALRAVFEHQTLAELAVAIEQARDLDRGDATTPIEPAPRDGTHPLPLSFAQQRLWFLHQLEEPSDAYNMAGAYRLRGALHVEALERAYSDILARHETLRTRFPAEGGAPRQVIEPPAAGRVATIDLSDRDEAEREAALRRLVDEEGASRFDLARGPLVRCRLLRLGPADHVLQVTLHHIISDGWSVRVFLDELIALYDHYRLGAEGAYPLPRLPVQYVDFACWQRAYLQGERLARQLAFWKAQLAGAPLLLSLPTDRPRPALQTMKGAVARFTLDSALTADLRALGRRFDVTFFMTLFAGFNVLLSRYSGQTDLLVGVPVANRTRKEIEGLIGFFVNTLVLRSDLSGNPTFDTLLRRVRQTTLDAYAHQDLPFEQVVEAVRPERSLSHHPLFQVMFDVQDADDEVMTLGDLAVEPLEPERVTSMFDVSVTLEELGGGLRGTIEYNTDLFADSTIRRMIDHFTALLRLLAAAPHRRIGELEMLGGGELAALEASWELAPPPALAGDPRRDACVHRLIARRAADDPGATALSSGDRHVSYGEMSARAGALARRLRALGVGPEVLVGLCAEDGIALVTGVLAVLMAGGAYLCLEPGHPRDRLAELLSDARPSVLLCSERDAAALSAYGAHGAHGAAVVTLDPFLEGSAPAGEAAAELWPCSSDNAAYVVYTSGTTGKPKGVTVTHRALVNVYLAWEHEFHLAGGPSCHLQMASSAFDVFSGEVLRALCSGGRLVFCPRGLLVEPDKLHALMRRQRVDCADFIPAVLRALSDHLEETGQDLGFMRLLVVGSDVWTAEDHARFRALCGPSTRLINAYGVSEATIDSTWFESQRLERDGERSVPIGRPMPGVRALVLDAHLMPVPAGVPGELFLGGPGVARGYLNRPGHTAERFIPDPFARTPGERLYRTGDLARLLPDGNLALLGRADHQVKIRGFRVEPDEIAAVVAAYPGVREAVVVVREDRPGEKRLVACLTLDDGGDGAPPLRVEDVKRFLRDKLPHYMVPSAIEVLDAMPLTPNRKIDRAALVRRRPEGVGPSSADAPRTPAEELLAGVFRDVLGVDTVRRSDSFFDLGGHSLLATQLASRAGKVFGRELPLRVIFEEPVLASLADYMQRAERRRQAPPLQRVSRDRPLPLSFSQEQLWTAAQFAPDSGAYNMSAGLRVRGALDVDVVRGALAEIARRHEILRMRVETVDGRPAMVVADEFPLAAVIEDLRGIHGREAREAELGRRFEAEVSAPFDLSRAPLVRLRIFQLAPEEAVLAFTLHHLLCDGWSLSVLVRELVACYESLAAGRPHHLPELPFQYADLAAWQRKWMSGEVLEEHIEHFARKLGGELPTLALPLDRPRSRRRSDAGARFVQPLDGELARALAELGRRAGATLNMTLMAGFLALLYRFSRQDDLLLGVTVAGRSQVEAEPLIGCFINNVVLRFDLSARPSYRDLLAQVRRETLEAYDHQALPFEKLIEALSPPREPGVTPFFQVVFGVQNTPSDELSIPGLAIEELPSARETARYDLTVWVHETAGALSVEWTYSTDLFEAATIHEMARGYEEVLRQVVRDPEIGLLALSSSRDSEATRGQGASKHAALKEKLLGARRQAKRIDLSE